jgi:streptogramin lyase
MIRHHNGSAWSTSTTTVSVRLNGVWAASSTDAWAVGDSGTLLHFDGTRWKSLPTGMPTSALGGVWGSSARDVWVTTGGGGLLHYDGNGWSSVPSGLGSTFAIAGRAQNDIWLTEWDTGGIAHFDGTTWCTETLSIGLMTVWPAPTGEVFVAGDNDGLIEHTP